LSAGTKHSFLVFRLTNQSAAIPLDNVARIAPMAKLVCPPGMPKVLEGFLNFAGTAVPVLRLDRLLQLPSPSPGLYSMLILLKGVSEGAIALLVDQVSEIHSIGENALLSVSEEHSFNGCSQGAVMVRGNLVHVLSPAHILMEKEREVLSEFLDVARLRLKGWESDER
jgi:chemotaxis signal transduction protein